MRKEEFDEALNRHFDKTYSLKAFKEKFCGKYLGSGVSREVYVFKPNPRYVVKIDYTKEFDNIREWIIWRNVCSDDRLSKHFAPCHWMRNDGKLLIQRRVRHKNQDSYPERLPNMFGDFKYPNYGFIGKDFVACDYSRVGLFYDGRLRKVDWWEYSNDILGKTKNKKYEQSSNKKSNKRKK